ncbi:hypothetical protein [Natrononativus amylolyticus]|uniref:hypothetical protein n=1 Tax=Natrononativus amylolyticus TaxID=2963434 RepID=UPI0020CFD195|nr:hypothetical protein [Natrononativus amylolyticus]
MIGSRDAVLYGLAAATGVFVLFGFVSAIVPNPFFVRMVEITTLDYAFLVLTSALVGLYVFQRTGLEGCSGDRCAYGGAAGGFLAVACPTCNALFVAAVGSSAVMTYVDPLRPLFGLVAVALLGGVIYSRRW